MILDGRKVSQEINNNLKKLIKENNLNINLAVIQVGKDFATSAYSKNRENKCKEVGINTITYNLGIFETTETLIMFINKLNKNKNIHGILLGLPLPSNIDTLKVINAIDKNKDVDGLTDLNVSALCLNKNNLVPCTPLGIIKLLEAYNIDLTGKYCVILGRSNIVGKPLFQLLLQKNATVTICHSKTNNLKEICNIADILISCMGKPEFIDNTFIKDNSIIIDVGINRDKNNKLCGDVDFNKVKDKVSYITPVPGGVGAMTNAMLLNNCYLCYKKSLED